jgi:hypothetical protein
LPTTITVLVRRYLCRACHAVIAVVPRGVLPRRHFSAATIGLALLLFGLGRQSGRQVRKRCSPWRTVGATATGWVQLRRWIIAVQSGSLFAGIKRLFNLAELHDRRLAAARAAMALCAAAPVGSWAPGDTAMEEQVFLGAAHMI